MSSMVQAQIKIAASRSTTATVVQTVARVELLRVLQGKNESYLYRVCEMNTAEVQAKSEVEKFLKQNNDTINTFEAIFERFKKLSAAKLYEDIDKLWPEPLQDTLRAFNRWRKDTEESKVSCEMLRETLSRLEEYEKMSMDTLQALSTKLTAERKASRERDGLLHAGRFNTQGTIYRILIEQREIADKKAAEEAEKIRKAENEAEQRFSASLQVSEQRTQVQLQQMRTEQQAKMQAQQSDIMKLRHDQNKLRHDQKEQGEVLGHVVVATKTNSDLEIRLKVLQQSASGERLYDCLHRNLSDMLGIYRTASQGFFAVDKKTAGQTVSSLVGWLGAHAPSPFGALLGVVSNITDKVLKEREEARFKLIANAIPPADELGTFIRRDIVLPIVEHVANRFDSNLGNLTLAEGETLAKIIFVQAINTIYNINDLHISNDLTAKQRQDSLSQQTIKVVLASKQFIAFIETKLKVLASSSVSVRAAASSAAQPQTRAFAAGAPIVTGFNSSAIAVAAAAAKKRNDASKRPLPPPPPFRPGFTAGAAMTIANASGAVIASDASAGGLVGRARAVAAVV